MIDHVERRFFAAILAFVLLICILPVEVFAAETKYPIEGKLSVTSSQEAKLQDGVVTVTAKPKYSNCDSNWSGTDLTVTITNMSTSAATVSFQYSEATNISGLITVTGATNTNGAVSGIVEAEKSITLKFKGDDNENNASLKLSDFTFVEKQSVNVTLKVPVNGSYTAGGTAVTAESTSSVYTTDAMAVVATAAEGYHFAGWYNETTGKYLSFKASDSLYFSEPTVLVPKFSPVIDATFAIDDTQFASLDEALAVAIPGSVIAALKDVTLTKDYTIPATVTLLIPYDGDHKTGGPDPKIVEIPQNQNYIPTAKLYRKLTLAENVTITVKGNLELGAYHYASHGGTTIGGTPVTGYGQIEMKPNSSIMLETGANLFAWGYITGSGTVNAKSGAKVYEKMQVSDYRGGNITTQIVCCNVFPFNQYYIQNVEVKTIYEAGASLIGHAGIYGSGLEASSVDFMGGDKAMFNITSGTATKYYNAQNDRLIIDVNGNVTMKSISIMSYDTSEYILPLNHNMTINIHEGHTASLAQDVMLLPGATINVDEGATLTLESGKKVYLMDASDWGAYCMGKKLEPISYVPALGTTPGIRTESNMTDAKINVNGDLIVKGSVYATSSGAQIVSGNESGNITFVAEAPSNTPTIYQSHVMAQQSSFHIGDLFGHSEASKNPNLTGFNVAPAVLTNGDNSTVNTSGIAAGRVVRYCAEADKWVQVYELTFDANGGTGTMESIKLDGDDVCRVTLPANAFTAPEGKVFAGWNTVATPTEENPGHVYDDEAILYDCTSDFTLYAQWVDEPTGLKGDTTMDGIVDMDDVVALMRHVLMAEVITDATALEMSEVTGDTTLDMDDVVKLMQYVLKAIDSLD